MYVMFKYVAKAMYLEKSKRLIIWNGGVLFLDDRIAAVLNILNACSLVVKRHSDIDYKKLCCEVCHTVTVSELTSTGYSGL